jgi:hypothetical protein
MACVEVLNHRGCIIQDRVDSVYQLLCKEVRRVIYRGRLDTVIITSSC